MNEPEICPACLTGLPDGYPFDHVAIDRALAGERPLFVRMKPPERAETVRTGLARGMSMSQMTGLFAWALSKLEALVPEYAVRAEHEAERAREGQAVHELWSQGKADVFIATVLGMSPYKVHRIRCDLGLPTLRRTGGTAARRWREGTPYGDTASLSSHQAASLMQPTEASVS